MRSSLQQFIKLDSYKGKLATISRDLKKIIQSYDTFRILYEKCRKDEFLFNVASLKFFASLSELDPVTTHLSFISFVNTLQFTPNPYLSKFFGSIMFKNSFEEITAAVKIQFYDQFSDPEKAFEIYNKYDYLENDSIYNRQLDNTNAGRIKISGLVELSFSKIPNIDGMISVSKEVFQGMYEYLCDLCWNGGD